MSENTAVQATIRPHIGTRLIGDSLCLINQKVSEIWLFQGISKLIWNRLNGGETPSQITDELHSRFGVAREKITHDVSRFLEELWQRRIIDLSGRESVSDTERGAMVSEKPHNKSDKLWKKAFSSDVLFRMWIDLLMPCNLRCRHCYLDFSKKDIIPFKDVCRYLDQLAEQGCPEVVLTGGEIFLRKDLLEIIAYTEHRGFVFELFTNGNFIDESMADQVAKHCIQAVQISLYGTNAELHERVTGTPGTFAKSMRAARLLIERGIAVRLVNAIQQDNFQDAFNYPEFAKSLGAEWELDSTIMPNRNGSQQPLAYGVTIRQQAELLKAGLIRQPNAAVMCSAAIGKGRITAQGDILPCNVIHTAALGNLKRNSLADIWASPWRAEVRHKILNYKPTRCESCCNVRECVPCPATRGFHQEGCTDAPLSQACVLTTASLVSKGQLPSPDSPLGKLAAAASSVDKVLSQSAGELIQQGLVQITLPATMGNAVPDSA
jgi:MoaA/NifB/PqqE/SkfB family radical SAM enzyme